MPYSGHRASGDGRYCADSHPAGAEHIVRLFVSTLPACSFKIADRQHLRGDPVFFMPYFQVEHRPQQLFVVLAFAVVLGQDLVHAVLVVVVRRDAGRADEVVEQVFLHFAAKPFIYRNTKAHFGPVQNGVGEDPLHGLPEQPFRGTAVQSVFIGHAGNEGCQLVVHERHPGLQRGSHGHAIPPFQEVVRQP